MIQAIAIILGFLPAFAWLVFFMQEDPDKEPPKLLLLAFLAGAGAAIATLFVQVLLNKGFETIGVATLAIVPLIMMALIEELMKFGAAYLAVRRNAAFDIPTDAMIYMIVVALGFATLENLGAISFEGGKESLFVSLYETATLRFVGATLLHALTSAIVGYYWAMSILKPRGGKFLAGGIALATVLHTIFNYLILHFDSSRNNNIVYAFLLVVAAGLFVLNNFEKLNKEKTGLQATP
jgi:RsiW-degrading membrane proteinase PrsW (M82 family)